MNADFDGAKIHQQELDREIETLRTEKLLNAGRPWRPGPAARGLASVGRGLISLGTALAGRVDALSAQHAESRGPA